MKAAASPYPLLRLDERPLPRAWRGPVFLWDVDKTYLDTRFSKLKDLLAIPFEFAIDKRALPGTVELLRGIRKGASGRAFHPIYFISASPRQMIEVLKRKMVLDGIEYDGLTLKDALALARQGRFKELKHQAAFKLSALLTQRTSSPTGAREYLFGDDAESDADIYSLYARIVSGEVRGAKLEEELRLLGTPEKGIPPVLALARGLRRSPAVRRIYIHLVKGTEPTIYERFGDLLLPCPTPLTMALDLFTLGLVSSETIADVAKGIRQAGGRSVPALMEEWRAYRARRGGRGAREIERALKGTI